VSSKGTTARDTRRDDLVKRAQRTMEDGAKYSPHDIAGAQEGWAYYAIPHDVNPSMRMWYRNLLTERGYEPVQKGDPEYVPSDGQAELWRCPPEVAEIWDQDRRDYARCEGRWDGQGTHKWGIQIWRQLQKQRNLRSKLE